MATPLNILIIEDSQDDAELIAERLTRSGFRLQWHRVETEEAFLKQLEAGPPDLILSDHSMPQFSGLRAAELLQARGLDVPFILVSGAIGEEAAVEAMRRGAVDYLLKDRIARLGPAVERALEQQRLRRAKVEAEVELRQTHGRLRHLLEHSPAVLYTLKVEGTDITPRVVSENIEALLGYTAAETVQREWWLSALHPEDRDRVLAEVSQALLTGLATLEYRLRHKAGGFRWVEDKRKVVRDDSGRPIEVVGVVTDISVRKRAETHRLAFARLANQLSSAQTAIEAGEIIIAVADQLFGWDACTLDLYAANQDRIFHVLNRDTVHGRRRSFPPTRDNVLPTSTARKVIVEGAQLILREPQIVTAETLRFGDTARPSASLMFVPIRHAAAVIGVLSIQSYQLRAYTPQDLSEFQALADHCGGALNRIQSETALRESEERLRQTQKLDLLGQLAGGVAHDFNNILAVIQGLASMIRLGPGLPADVLDAADQMVQAADRGAGLTRQLLSFSRNQVTQPRDLDLNELTTNLLKMLRRMLGVDVELDFRPARGLPLVHGDAVMMQQVLMNLAVNARDAMPRGGRLTIETGAVDLTRGDAELVPETPPGRYVCLSVADTGCGIPAEVLPRIFEPFFTTKEPGRGTGIGLATVHGIVRQHQGWIRIQSRVGEGTTFRIYLPMVRPTPSPVSPASSSMRPPLAGTETILVAEDELPLRGLIRNVLTRHGYRVLEAGSGPEALEIWRQHRGHIDLLFTDMMMPGGLNGKELAEQLLVEAPQLKVIYNSAYAPEIVLGERRDWTPANFLHKPYSLLAMVKLVREVLDQK